MLFEDRIFYHMYPLGLCGAPESNDSGPLFQKEEGAVFAVENEWIDHMKDLGFSGVYIGPLFESSTHGYDTRDYRRVDRRLGNNEGFRKWVAACHEQGIKVVVDGVFNHTGREFPAFQNLQEQKWDSWGKDWYCQVDFNGTSPLGDPFSYESWRGYPELPRLNLKNPAVVDALMDVVRFWVSAFDIDGVRLDCADVLDFDYMRRLRRETEQMKPEFWLMGEVIHGDYSRWVNPEMLHSVTNYELHKAIYSAHNSHNYFEMAHTLRRLFGEYGLCKGAVLYNFADNHDVDRIGSKLACKADLLPVYVFLYTIHGIPSVYYGSEFGMEGRRTGDSDRPLRPQIKLSEMEDGEVTRLLRRLAHIRQSQKALIYGNHVELLLTNRQYMYARCWQNEICVTALNNDDSVSEMDIGLPGDGKLLKDLISGGEIPVENGRVHLKLQGHDGRIYQVK